MSSMDQMSPVRVAGLAVFFFVLALALRLLFLNATADASGPYSPYYKGDTPIWLDYALAIRSSAPFDLGLPLRPPGVGYLVALAWDGTEGGYPALRVTWCVLGASVTLLLFLAAWRSFGLAVASVAAFVAAASTGMMILSTAPNNEMPYLFLVLAGFTLWEPVRHRPRMLVLLPWAVLNGAACLVRVEHVLFFALVSACLLWAWAHPAGRATAWRAGLGRTALVAALFLAPLAPWQWHVRSQVERFNNEPLPVNAATERAYLDLERALAGLRWTPGAVGEREALPAFARRAMTNFVGATVAVRGGVEVTAADFQVIEEAFGSRPEPIGRHPFVALYGGLNFFLANHPLATGGFTRAPLEAPPPLAGGPARYPAFLIAGLPPPDLVFSYPPHVDIVNHGYRRGLDWIVAHPFEYLSLAMRKLQIFWSGVTLGFTGYNLPLGTAGVRRVVDLATPAASPGAIAWRAAGLALLLAGLWAGRREQALVPWVLLLCTKVVVTAAFFGYAREGAVVIPVFAVLLGLAAARGLPALPGFRRLGEAVPGGWPGLLAAVLLAVALVAVEAYRRASEPVLTLDGHPVGAQDPFPGMEYVERRLGVE